MNDWLKSIIAGLLVGITSFFLFDSLQNKPGDPVYKMHYTVKPSATAGSHFDKEQAIATTVIQKRLSGSGYKVSFQRPGNDQLDVIIENVRDTALVKKIIGNSNRLAIRELYTLEDIAPGLVIALRAADSLKKVNLSTLVRFSVDNGGQVIRHGSLGVVSEKDTATVNQILSDPQTTKSLPADLVFYYGFAEKAAPGKSEIDFLYLYAISGGKQEFQIDNEDIESAKATKGLSDNPEILIEFTSAGTKKWQYITAKNTGHYLPIIVDGIVISAPYVNEPILGAKASISGGFTAEECRVLALQLNSGSIPAGLRCSLEEVSAGIATSGLKKMTVVIISFVFAAGLAFIVFKSLGNRQQNVMDPFSESVNGI